MFEGTRHTVDLVVGLTCPARNLPPLHNGSAHARYICFCNREAETEQLRLKQRQIDGTASFIEADTGGQEKCFQVCRRRSGKAHKRPKSGPQAQRRRN